MCSPLSVSFALSKHIVQVDDCNVILFVCHFGRYWHRTPGHRELSSPSGKSWVSRGARAINGEHLLTQWKRTTDGHSLPWWMFRLWHAEPSDRHSFNVRRAVFLVRLHGFRLKPTCQDLSNTWFSCIFIFHSSFQTLIFVRVAKIRPPI